MPVNGHAAERRATRGGGSRSASVAIHPAGYSVGSSKMFVTWSLARPGYPPSNRVVAPWRRCRSSRRRPRTAKACRNTCASPRS